MKLGVAFLLLAGCSCGDADVAPESAPVHCEVVFSPVAELSAAVAVAAARWSAATGCDIRLGNGGIVARTAPVLTHSRTGESLLGGTHWTPIEVVIDADIDGETLQLTVDHEMGHALTGRPAHAGSGLMAPRAPVGSPIDAASLGQVCGALACLVFHPE